MDDEETSVRAPDEQAADVREGLARLGLRAVGATDGAGPWAAVSADGTEHEVTVVSVSTPDRWEMLRTRTTALLALEHENVVPLVGAMPVGDRAAPAPRTLVLVWLAARARARGAAGPRASEVGAGSALPGARVLDVLVGACRGAVALRACGIAVPAAAVDVLVAEAAYAPCATSPLQLHPWPWALVDARTQTSVVGGAGAHDEPHDEAHVHEARDEPHDVTRRIAQRFVRHLERTGAGAPRAVRDLLDAATGTTAPAPGDLAMRALDLRAAIDADPGAHPDVPAGPEAPGPPALTPTAADWRAIVRDAEAFTVVPPPQARSAAGSAAGSVARSAARSTERDSARSTVRPHDGQGGPRSSPVAPSPSRSDVRRTSSLPGRPASRPLPRARGARRAPRAVVVAGVVTVVVAGAAALLHERSGAPGLPRPAHVASAPDAPVVPAPDAPAASAGGAPTSPTPTPGDPAEAARRATVGRVDVLAGLAPVAAEDLASTTAAVEARLAAIVGPGPVRDADLALVARVLRGEETPPRARAEVSAAEVLAQDATTASVAVTYTLVPGGGELRHTLRLTRADGTWKVVSVELTGTGPTP